MGFCIFCSSLAREGATPVIRSAGRVSAAPVVPAISRGGQLYLQVFSSSRRAWGLAPMARSLSRTGGRTRPLAKGGIQRTLQGGAAVAAPPCCLYHTICPFRACSSRVIKRSNHEIVPSTSSALGHQMPTAASRPPLGALPRIDCARRLHVCPLRCVTPIAAQDSDTASRTRASCGATIPCLIRKNSPGVIFLAKPSSTSSSTQQCTLRRHSVPRGARDILRKTQ